ncbi:MAG TPA: DinB family protein [Pyrinomonadaceae bacterium]|nr:DinB family protein [Pyrinomonadaceae bacterium]
MRISEMILMEFDNEMAGTRRTLERVPEDRLDWKPHEKSTAMGDLATHLANIPTWAVHALKKDSLDIAPVDGPPPRVEPAQSRQELLERFDSAVRDARTAINEASNEELMQPWSLLRGGTAVMTLPRVGVLRGFVMNHTIHHRAQLGVYLRLNDIPVPSIYGPSADEAPF